MAGFAAIEVIVPGIIKFRISSRDFPFQNPISFREFEVTRTSVSLSESKI